MKKYKVKSVQCSVFCGVFLLFAVFMDTTSVAAADGSQWSGWFNSDSPDFGQGDDETTERIWMTVGLPCRPEDVTSVQCRRAGQGSSTGEEEEIFHHQSLYRGNVLHVPCNNSGLLCRHRDQTLPSSLPPFHVALCADYEIRVRCYGPDNGGQGDAITSHAAFIGVVSGGSVVLPLVLVLVLRFTKAKLEQRRRQQATQTPAHTSTQEDNQEAEATMSHPPPAYDLLFACPQPVSISSSNTGEDEDDQRTSCPERRVNGHVTGTDHVGEGGVYRDEGSLVLASSEVPSPPAVISTESSGHPEGVNAERALPSGLPCIAASDRLPVPLSRDGVRRVSSESMSSVSSTRPLLTPVSSVHDIHTDPPPAYDWPGVPSHVTVVMPAGRSEGGGCEEPGRQSFAPATPPVGAPPPASIRPPPRRFLGMHLSILDLMAGMYPETAPTPPPTYDDALKILGVPPHPEVQVT